MTNKANMGKWAEKQVALVLDQCSNGSSSFAWHRLPDARSARGLLAAQPSDMIVSFATKHGNRTIYLEVKETKDIRRLQKAKIGQYGLLYKFWLTQAHVLVLVFMSTHQQWVMLTGRQLFCYDECPPSFLLTDLKPYDTAAEALSAYFEELA
jgi:mRNA-degrading endonuclease RelE of RelBE toxin-antitoxin system